MAFLEKEPNKQSFSSQPNMSTDDSSDDNAQDNLDFSSLSGNLYENHPDLVEQTRAFSNDYESIESPVSSISNNVDKDLFFSSEDDSSDDNAQDNLDFSSLSGNLYENRPDLVEQTRAFSNNYESIESPVSSISNDVDNDTSSTPSDTDCGDSV